MAAALIQVSKTQIRLNIPKNMVQAGMKVMVAKVVQLLARRVCEASSSDGLIPCTTPIKTRKAIGVKSRRWL